MNTAFPNKCRHCDPAPCLAICPTAAIRRGEDHPEIVVIESRKCISCGMCAMVCPFDVISYHAVSEAPEKKTVAIKCDHCLDRLRKGQDPVCVAVCKVGALQYGEINELVKLARTRYSEVVSVAVGQISPEMTAPPPQVEGWRSWGSIVTRLNTDDRKGE